MRIKYNDTGEYLDTCEITHEFSCGECGKEDTEYYCVAEWAIIGWCSDCIQEEAESFNCTVEW